MALSDRRCMVRTRPPVAKLRAADETVAARAGSVVECKLILDRTSQFSGDVQVELIDSPPGVVRLSEQAEIPAGKDSVTLKVRLSKEASRSSAPSLKFRATGKISG